jgi:alkylation response protein AidB-like acyl-CoA dehydrogenase
VISFKKTEEQEIVCEAMHGFAEEAMRPIARECDEASAISEEFLAQSWELGLVTTQIPEEFGGDGEARSPITNALVLEELAWGDASHAIAAMAPAAFANAIVDQGTDAQKRQYLPQLCTSSYHAASLAVCESGPLFDATRPRTKAEPKGDGFVLSGAKSFVPMADRASHFLVVARNNGGLDAFIVDRNAEGLTISETEKNLGLRALPTATLELERVEVGAADRLGGDAGDVAKLLQHSRAALAAVMLGVARSSVDYAVPYAVDREAFGEKIAQKQGIAFKIADMHIETEATRWLIWKAAAQLEQGVDAARSTHIAHNYAIEQSMMVADEGIQVLGGHGFIREHPVELWYRNARTLGVLDGTLSL